jgi:inorganic pyrophosphatase
MLDETFWQTLDALVASSGITIDRPAGSAHPRYPETIYPLDYGYLEASRSSDGAGIDIWRGSLPDTLPTGIIVTVDLLKRNSEIKILLGCTSAEMELLVALHSRGQQAGLLLRREIR